MPDATVSYKVSEDYGRRACSNWSEVQPQAKHVLFHFREALDTSHKNGRAKVL